MDLLSSSEQGIFLNSGSYLILEFPPGMIYTFYLKLNIKILEITAYDLDTLIQG